MSKKASRMALSLVGIALNRLPCLHSQSSCGSLCLEIDLPSDEDFTNVQRDLLLYGVKIQSSQADFQKYIHLLLFDKAALKGSSLIFSASRERIEDSDYFARWYLSDHPDLSRLQWLQAAP